MKYLHSVRIRLWVWLLLLCVSGYGLLRQTTPQMRNFRLGLIVGIICLLILALRDALKRFPRLPVIQNAWLMSVSVLVTLLLLEVVFQFFPYSTGYGNSLSSGLWFSKYWAPMNRSLFRDNEIRLESHLRPIVVLGDSIVAGHGIKNVQDRFSNVMARALPGDYQVVNVARCGWNTLDQLAALKTLNLKPAIIVLAYFLNDIEGTVGHRVVSPASSNPFRNLSPVTASMVQNFYLPNFLFFNRVHWDLFNYEEAISNAYTSEKILNAHLADLKNLIDYGRGRNAQLAVMLFPFVNQIELSRKLIKPVLSALDRWQVPVFDTAGIIEQLPARQRAVNRSDPHPSREVNRRIGTLLARWLLDDLKWIARGRD